ncbi:MAG: metallophosphoesterase [Crocinitomicaceae bacterium]|nr:metallophosphoesterase [Crocinitomicaceae bacterium]
MPTAISFIIFILIIGLLEWYLFASLRSRWNHWSSWLKNTVKYGYFFLLILSVLSITIMFFFSSAQPKWLLNFWFSFIVINILTKLTFTVFLIIDDVWRLSIFTRNKIKGTTTSENAIGRSDFLLKTGLGVAAIPFTSLSWGMIAGPYRYKVFSEKINIPNLPKTFDGLKIVQISDVHSGSFYSKEAVQRGVDLVMAQKADVIFFTGDIVNDNASEMEPYIEMFSEIKAPMGVYSILGNHDYGDYANWDSEQAKLDNRKAVRELHDRMGWRLLLNEHVYLEKDQEKIGLIGVENWGAGFHQEGDLEKAYEGIDAPVKLLLSHDPTHFDEIVKKEFKDINITFSGHTHGAQMGIETANFKWSPISLRYAKWAGLYQENEQYLYINRGFGFLGFAGRVGIMPEITVMELRS